MRKFKVVVKTYNGDAVKTNTYRIEADGVSVSEHEEACVLTLHKEGEGIVAAFSRWDLVIELPPATAPEA